MRSRRESGTAWRSSRCAARSTSPTYCDPSSRPKSLVVVPAKATSIDKFLSLIVRCSPKTVRLHARCLGTSALCSNRIADRQIALAAFRDILTVLHSTSHPSLVWIGNTRERADSASIARARSDAISDSSAVAGIGTHLAVPFTLPPLLGNKNFPLSSNAHERKSSTLAPGT